MMTAGKRDVGPSVTRWLGGITKGFVEALEPFGLRPNDPAFWGEALTAHLGGLMDEAEAIAKELGYAA